MGVAFVFDTYVLRIKLNPRGNVTPKTLIKYNVKVKEKRYNTPKRKCWPTSIKMNNE